MSRELESGSLPKGTIVAWYSRDSAVPAGWAICDGKDGTPDLTGRFLRGGASSDAGQTGGSEVVTVTNAEYPGHDSSTYSKVATGGGTLNVTKPGHDHGANVLPPYFTVVYIMKR